jgi:hypothetical protein
MGTAGDPSSGKFRVQTFDQAGEALEFPGFNKRNARCLVQLCRFGDQLGAESDELENPCIHSEC